MSDLYSILNHLTPDDDEHYVEQKTKLWDATSTSSSFPAQTLSLDLSTYRKIQLVFVPKAGDAQCVIQEIENQTQGLVTTIYSDTSVRLVTVANSGVTFGSGLHGNASTGLSVNDAYVIPKVIYGIKVVGGGGYNSYLLYQYFLYKKKERKCWLI